MSSRRIRYSAPVVVVGLIAAGAWLPTLQAAATPDLPTISPQHLVEKALGEKVSHLSGTYAWDADLGLPSLSGITDGSGQDPSSSSGFSPTSLLSGDHSFEVWIDGAAKQRIASPGTLEESDFVHDGNQAWTYDSSTNHVTHYVRRPSSPARYGHSFPVGGPAHPGTLGVRPTPAAIADELLSGVRTLGTDLSVSRPVEVAGRPAYVLRIAPDRSVAANRASTVAYATIAVDARTGLPLRTTIYAVGQSSPALQVGFTSISYATPSSSEFVAPKGQSTTTKLVGPTAAPGRSGWVGYAPLTASGSAADPFASISGSPISGSSPQGGGWITTGELNATRTSDGTAAAATATASGPVTNAPMGPGPRRRSGWRAPETLPSTTSYHPAGTDARNWAAVWTLRSVSISPSSQRLIDSVTTEVSGRWGSGRLLGSTLVNALMLDNGTILVGAVTPAALEAAAAHLSH